MFDLKEKLERVKISDLFAGLKMLCALPFSLIYKIRRPDMWLICESENEARDNGYWLYKYLRENHPDQDVVYAINKKSPDYRKICKLGAVIQYGSFKHWVYYLAADKNISSQKGGKPNAAVCYVLEVGGIRKNKTIFLQHGITKDDMPWLYYENTKMDLFVCGAQKEYEYIKEVYGYPESNVKYLGFTRFDTLHDFKIKKNQILVMPTWREWLGTPTSKSNLLDDMSAFENTEYFKKWNGFLNDKRLDNILKKNNMTILFYPHRNMQPFLNKFTCQSDNIKIASWKKYDVQELLKESALLITDYSSVFMDFAYMRKPIIYYQFDKEKFRQGQYKEGYFKYERDGFGPVIESQADLVDTLEDYIDNGLRIESIYQTREEEFFPIYDTDNCKRNYEEILRI